MRILFLLLAIIGLTLLPVSSFADVAIDTRITIKPGNGDEAAEKLVKQAIFLKGYFLVRSNERVQLKVPSRAADKLQQFIEDNWLVYQQDYQANDLTAQLIDAKSKLNAKEDLLSEYQKILVSARKAKLVKVSTAVTSLVKEIELLRGRINYMRHQLRYAKFTVYFKIDRSTMVRRQVSSSFPWLNSVGLPKLLSDFSQ
jgi:hypothetical protein